MHFWPNPYLDVLHISGFLPLSLLFLQPQQGPECHCVCCLNLQRNVEGEGRAEHMARAAGPAGYGKLLRSPGAEQARPAPSQARQPLLLLLQAPPTPFLAVRGPAEMGPPADKRAQLFLPPLARGFARPRPLPGRRQPWGGKVKGMGFVFSEVLPRPDILFIL